MPTVLIRFLPPDHWEWEEACIQFTYGGSFRAATFFKKLQRLCPDVEHRQVKNLVYTKS